MQILDAQLLHHTNAMMAAAEASNRTAQSYQHAVTLQAHTDALTVLVLPRRKVAQFNLSCAKTVLNFAPMVFAEDLDIAQLTMDALLTSLSNAETVSVPQLLLNALVTLIVQLLVLSGARTTSVFLI